MHKIANTTELQSELHRILAYSQSGRPSRKRIAAALKAVSARLVQAADDGWTEKKKGVWLVGVQYAGGAKHMWGIYPDGEKFGVEVDTPDGTYQRKTQFDSVEKAKRYAGKFLKANGQELLEDVLDKDFKPVRGHRPVSPLNG